MAEVNPTPEAVTHLVPEFREKFQTKHAKNISSGVYDERDVKRLMSDDPYARCFLRTLKSRGDIDKALEVVDDAFKFRKEYTVNDLTEDSFPENMKAKHGMYYQGTDNKGHNILYMNTKANSTSSDEMPMMKKYIAYFFEKHHKENPEQMCVVLMDMSGAGTGNVSRDIFKFTMACFTTNFPSYLAYMLNYEMPMILSAFWKMVSAFLSKDQSKKVVIVKKKDIGKYLNDDALWPHMRS